jgi:hypothetical protein
MKYLTAREIREQWPEYPEAWIKWMLEQAERENDRFGWSERFFNHSLEFVRRTLVSNPHIPETPIQTGPTALQMAETAAIAAAQWIAGGMEVADETTRMQRQIICSTCELWDAAARFGLGKCKHPHCGCTKVKQWLATEKCPLGKWSVP